MWQATAGILLQVRYQPFGRDFWVKTFPFVLIVLGVLLLAAVFFKRFKEWYRGTDRLSAKEQLAEFRSSYERGEMSREEFDRVHGLLAEQVRREEIGKPAGAVPPAETVKEAPASSPAGNGAKDAPSAPEPPA